MERQQVRKTISWTCSQWQNNTTSQALSTVVFIFVFLYYWKNSITDIISSLYSKMQCEEGDLWFSLRRKDRTLFSFKHVQLCDYGCVWHQTVLTTTPRCCASFLKRTVAQHAGVLVSTVPSQQKGPAYKSTGRLGALLCACSLRVLQRPTKISVSTDLSYLCVSALLSFPGKKRPLRTRYVQTHGAQCE